MVNSQFYFDNVEATFIYGIDLLNDITSQPLVDGRIWVPEMNMDNLAGFVQSKWVINDDFIIKAGVRREDIDLEVDDYRTLKLCKTATLCSIPIDVTGDTLNYRATTYNFAIRYNFSEFFQPFASYSQGADISDIGRLLRTATVTDIADIQTEASIIDNYEIGFSSNFDKIRVEFSAFRSTSELGTTNKYDPNTGVYMPVRAPQEIYGYEALAVYNVNETLNISGSFSWVEGKDKANDVYLGIKQISPPKTVLNINWRPVENSRVSFSYLYVGDRHKFEPENGSYVGDLGNIDAYSVLNVSGQYQFTQALSGFIGVENLLNNDYYPAKSQGYTYSGYNVKGLGTTVNMGVSYHF